MTEPSRQPREPIALHERAASDLRFIRGAMERSAGFTAVPGRGAMAMGGIALVAAALVSSQPTADRWLLVWVAAAATACVVGGIALRRKCAHTGQALLGAAGRRFLLCLCPALAAGAALTPVLHAHGLDAMLPGTWLLLYGAGVIAAGAFSVSVVPVAGAAFFLTGIAALLVPAGWGDVAMAAGFGAGHLIAGFIVARNHGG